MQDAGATSPVLALSGITRTFKQGKRVLDVLRGADLEIQAGEVVALVGPSGSGKSTLLQIAGLLEQPTAGDIRIDGQSCVGLNDDDRTKIRRYNIGFVYQYHHLLPEFSALENITIPQIIAGIEKAVSRSRARELLDWMGLADRADHRPGQLSGGEQQRVAIARALAASPRVLLADEPTGNLDPATAEDVFGALMHLARGAGLAALVATHNPDIAKRMDRIVRVENGVLVAG
ncbi:MAG: ABC transporter ATP-binding protein [Rhodospirillales bacterium]